MQKKGKKTPVKSVPKIPYSKKLRRAVLNSCETLKREGKWLPIISLGNNCINKFIKSDELGKDIEKMRQTVMDIVRTHCPETRVNLSHWKKYNNNDKANI